MKNTNKTVLLSSHDEIAKWVRNFFDCVLRGKKFLRVLSFFRKLQGYDTECISIFFRSDFEEWDEYRCSENNITIILGFSSTVEMGYMSFDDFYKNIEFACIKYLEKFPLDANKINYLLTEIQIAFGLAERPVGYQPDDAVLQRKLLGGKEFDKWLTIYLENLSNRQDLADDVGPLWFVKEKKECVIKGVGVIFKQGFEPDDKDVCSDNEVAIIVEYPTLPDDAIGYISFSEFYKLLTLACKKHNELFPQDTQAVERHLQEIKKGFNLA